MADRPYELDERMDFDLWPFRDRPMILRALLDETCRCGHPRREHSAATGALGSFGGSACHLCWYCGTFTAEQGALVVGRVEEVG